MVDQLVQHQQTRAAPDDLGMHRQDEDAAHAMGKVELAAPEGKHLVGVTKTRVHRLVQKGEMREVVQLPGDWKLDQPTVRAATIAVGVGSLGQWRKVGLHVIGHHAGIVDQPAVLQEADGLFAEVPGRRAVALGLILRPQHRLQPVDLAVKKRCFLTGGKADRRFVGIAVQTDFVPSVADSADHLGVGHGRMRRGEESRRDRFAGQQVQKARHADPCAVVPPRQGGRRSLAKGRDPQRGGVEVKGQADIGHR